VKPRDDTHVYRWAKRKQWRLIVKISFIKGLPTCQVTQFKRLWRPSKYVDRHKQLISWK